MHLDPAGGAHSRIFERSGNVIGYWVPADNPLSNNRAQMRLPSCMEGILVTRYRRFPK